MVDGLSIVYNLFKFISAQGIEQAYSYYYVKKHLFQFLDYLEYRGLEIAYFCVDSIMQDDKTDLINERAADGVSKLFDCIDSNFTIGSCIIVENWNVVSGSITPLIIVVVIKCLREYYNNTVSIIFSGRDPDK